MRKTQKLVDKLLAELERTGIPLTACSKVGVARSTYYRWRQDSISFKLRSDDAIRIGRENITDFAESKLVNNIGDGNQRAIEFQLRHNDPRYRYFSQLEFARLLEDQAQEKKPNVPVIRTIVDILFDAMKIDIPFTEEYGSMLSVHDREMMEIDVKESIVIQTMKELIEAEVTRRWRSKETTSPNNPDEDTVQ